jgi:transposase
VDRTVIGIDVSKDHLDAATSSAGPTRRFPNDPAGIADLVAWAAGLAPDRIVFESTGAYQKAAVGALLAAGLPAVVVNARQVRDFAKGLGRLGKTDALDAGVLVRFGQVVPTTVRPLPAPAVAEFQQLFDRRAQLVRMLAAEKNHRHAHAAGSAKVRKSIDAHIAYLERQIQGLERQMDAFIEATEAYRAKDEVLRSIPGIGPQVSRTLLAHLPELGTGTRQTLAALAGLAPYNDDSGTQTGSRHIVGGRAKVRVGLYQAAVVAITHCPEMTAFYARLKARGKPSKVALVAVARKLLALANALLRTMMPYQTRANSVGPQSA